MRRTECTIADLYRMTPRTGISKRILNKIFERTGGRAAVYAKVDPDTGLLDGERRGRVPMSPRGLDYHMICQSVFLDMPA